MSKPGDFDEVKRELAEAGREVAGVIKDVAGELRTKTAQAKSRRERRDEERERRHRQAELARSPEGARARLGRKIEGFVFTSLLLTGIWWFTGADVYWPAFAILPLGLGVALTAWRARGARRPAPDAPVAESGLKGRVNLLADALVHAGRGPLAASLESGMAEVEALAHFRESAGVEAAQEEARTEEVRLRARAAAVSDPEARATWIESADTAARRLEKLAGLAAEQERAAARIEAFTQRVKSLELDLARMRERPEGGGVFTELDTQAVAVEREVEALHRTREEMRRLEARVRG